MTVLQDFIDAQATQDYISVPSGTYVFGGTLPILSGKVWDFQNVTIIQQNPSCTAILANGQQDFHITGRLTIRGPLALPETHSTRAAMITAARAFTGSQGDGFRVIGGNLFSIDGVTIEGINGVGMRLDGSTYGAFLRGERGVISNLTLRGNWNGFNASTPAAEYLLVRDIMATGNKYAMNVAAGNVRANGGNIVDNVGGLYLSGGTNNAHGGFVGFNFNHNEDYNLWANGVTHCESFEGCHVFGDSGSLGKIKFEDSDGITMSGGIISAAIENSGAAGKNMIQSVRMSSTSVTPTVGGTHADSLLRKGNYDSAGMWSLNN